MEICIVLPAYNAGKTIRPVAEESLQPGFPVLVVDDGSADGMAESLAGLPVETLSHPENRGKGAALRTGFSWALRNGFSGVVTLDADGQHDPAAIPLLVEAALERKTDILIAS
ncbi:MAG: glycosyltransferase family 2 protein, partial [Geobacteraceae bacterium]|nr:glycosyltransferase family 2 protein [Geobacteraceae bacterium]